MPVLNPGLRRVRPEAPAYYPGAGGRLPVETLAAGRELAPQPRLRPGWFETCANPRCASRSLKMWRGRGTAFFERGWCCSPGCLRAQVESALRRETEVRGAAPESHRHRIPLGLVLLEQGWITAGQLRDALAAQKAAGAGRLGQWLLRRQAVSEELLTRALGLQWSCPVLSLESHDAESMAALLPRLFVDAFGCLPLRVAAARILYLGFEDRPDPVLALAVERMTGLRVESGLLPGSVFRPAQKRMLAARYPRTALTEAVSAISLGTALVKAMEGVRCADARLVRIHDCLWLRLWVRPQRGPYPEREAVEDLIGAASGR